MSESFPQAHVLEHSADANEHSLESIESSAQLMQTGTVLGKSSHPLQDNNIHLANELIDTSSIEDHPIAIPNSLKASSQRLILEPVNKVAVEALNYASLGELLRAKNGVPPLLQLKIDALARKSTQYVDTYWYERYFPQCSLISMLDQSISTRICMCGLRGKKHFGINPTGLCNKPRLCMHCARRNVQNTLRTFGPAFHRHQWGFLTLSYHGDLPFTHISGPDWSRHWDAAKSAVKRLVANEIVGGAMIREELAILSLNPTSVQPHVHAIVPAGELSKAAEECLSSWMQGYRDDQGDGVSMPPSIKFERIATEEDFNRIVQYIHKPIDFVTPYVGLWGLVETYEEKVMINRAIRDAMEAVIVLTQGQRQIDYFGNMRAASKRSFIGVPLKERKQSST